MDDGQSHVPARVLVAQLARAVRRAVVDHDDLEVAVGLREDAVQRLPEVGQHVVDGRYHAHEGAVFMRSGLHLRLGARLYDSPLGALSASPLRMLTLRAVLGQQQLRL